MDSLSVPPTPKAGNLHTLACPSAWASLGLIYKGGLSAKYSWLRLPQDYMGRETEVGAAAGEEAVGLSISEALQAGEGLYCAQALNDLTRRAAAAGRAEGQ